MTAAAACAEDSALVYESVIQKQLKQLTGRREGGPIVYDKTFAREAFALRGRIKDSLKGPLSEWQRLLRARSDPFKSYIYRNPSVFFLASCAQMLNSSKLIEYGMVSCKPILSITSCDGIYYIYVCVYL
jgi:hypothetical protein